MRGNRVFSNCKLNLFSQTCNHPAGGYHSGQGMGRPSFGPAPVSVPVTCLLSSNLLYSIKAKTDSQKCTIKCL